MDSVLYVKNNLFSGLGGHPMRVRPVFSDHRQFPAQNALGGGPVAGFNIACGNSASSVILKVCHYDPSISFGDSRVRRTLPGRDAARKKSIQS